MYHRMRLGVTLAVAFMALASFDVQHDTQGLCRVMAVNGDPQAQAQQQVAAGVSQQQQQQLASAKADVDGSTQAQVAALEALEKAGQSMSVNEAAAAMFGGAGTGAGLHDDLMAAESALGSGTHEVPPGGPDHKAAYAAMRANEALMHAQHAQHHQHMSAQMQNMQHNNNNQHQHPQQHAHQHQQQHQHQPVHHQQAIHHSGARVKVGPHGQQQAAMYVPPVGRQMAFGVPPQTAAAAYQAPMQHQATAAAAQEQLMPQQSAPIAAHAIMAPTPQQQPQQQMLVPHNAQPQGIQQQQAPQVNGNGQLEEAGSGQHAILAPRPSSVASSGVSGGGPESAAGMWPLVSPDVPKIVALEVKCEKNLMKVSIEFDKIFNGIIFSKGHYSDQQCVHVAPNSAKQSAYFDIGIGTCGTQGNTLQQQQLQLQQQQRDAQNGAALQAPGATSSGTFFENTIVVQYDAYVQEVWDQARKLRCTWHDQYEKAVTFRPFPVDMLDIVRADFAGDNVGCWMQIQVGKGPWASEVAGIVKIGQTMTMVLAIKDEENKFDMLVRNCFAHDGKRGPIELVDKNGCITRPKLMSRFTKIKNFGSSATVLSYAHFQAFKFPDSMEVHFQCTIQICRHQCPEQCNAGGIDSAASTYSESTLAGTFNINARQSGNGGAGADQAGADAGPMRKSGHVPLSRARRSLNATQQHVSNIQNVGLNRVIQVVSSNDLAFALPRSQSQQSQPQSLDGANQQMLTTEASLQREQVCMSSLNFVIALLVLILTLLISLSIALSLYMRQRSFTKCSKLPAAASASTSSTSVVAMPTNHNSNNKSNAYVAHDHHHHLHHHHNQNHQPY
ncbi:hypothetical protein GZH46_01481 [Fragariocoptes setiger]|uniref:ZP domain-containing protein n=1 Tax=Fragariocoptes setiger TaxID=1670756 RepID=A0ABQ7S984_9ACAR|nr:hypothetical protein GZH46_01481 [Fragariocoptes setiger]